MKLSETVYLTFINTFKSTEGSRKTSRLNFITKQIKKLTSNEIDNESFKATFYSFRR